MTRLKLWAFYQLMAWNSLIRPKDGLQMIECAEEGKAKQEMAKRMNAIFGLAQRSKRRNQD